MAAEAMKVIEERKAKIAHPTGDPNFAVLQPFPSAFPAEMIDPFLMCDEFGPTLSKGIEKDPDKFSVNWHPHVGMARQDLPTLGCNMR